ncbi:MAG TPA: zinc-binding protein [Deltaproteobacteria bacterium]|nr:zinc-binding protein [Deltaproteobacteria bacterium]
MAEDCCATNGNVMILACAGGSNVGQLSNQAAVELTQEGFGKIFCLAGVGGHLSGFVQSARDVPQMVAIDGCSVGCVKAILEHAEVPLKQYLVLTDLGIEKNKNFNLARADVEKVKTAVKASTGGSAANGQPSGKTSSGSCCNC